MRVYLQPRPGHLIVSLEGVASSIGDDLGPGARWLRRLEPLLERPESRQVLVDFRDLALVDAASLRAILVHFRQIGQRRKVKLVGPGRALRTLFRLLAIRPPVRFFPSLAAARSTFGTSFERGDAGWESFLSQFDAREAGEPGLQGLRSRLGDRFTVDLEEEAAFLRGEGDTEWSRSPPVVPDLRRRSASRHGARSARRPFSGLIDALTRSASRTSR